MNLERIAFNRACTALREGNPYPFLSGRVEFPPGVDGSIWQDKAAAMRETLEAVCTPIASTRVADEVERIFMLDPDTKNMRIAKKFLTDLLAACGAVSDEDYASFLASFLPPSEIVDAVANSRQYQDQVAAHIRSLLAKLSE
jgi:5S rRNA maturation endonuclease (ribonuclease M5)